VRELGRGQFAYVLECSLTSLPHSTSRSAVTVAAKVLHQSASAEDSRLFLLEALRMRHLKHTHVLQLVAVCVDNSPHMLMFEYMQNGDVKTYMGLCRDTACDSLWTSQHALRIGHDVAAGLTYLAQHKFVHRDIAARNVLLDAAFCAKLGDFGKILFVLDCS
jgi:proto-oncogene tyrosine-protein kinase ROS